jgi:hypothetical protein
MAFIDNLAQTIDLVFSQVTYLGSGVNLGLRQNLTAQGRAYAIDILQRDPYLLVFRYIYSGNTCHLQPPHFKRGYPCRCLCRGLEQIILTTPRRFTTLHFSHLTLTEAFTFIFNPVT